MQRFISSIVHERVETGDAVHILLRLWLRVKIRQNNGNKIYKGEGCKIKKPNPPRKIKREEKVN